MASKIPGSPESCALRHISVAGCLFSPGRHWQVWNCPEECSRHFSRLRTSQGCSWVGSQEPGTEHFPERGFSTVPAAQAGNPEEEPVGWPPGWSLVECCCCCRLGRIWETEEEEEEEARQMPEAESRLDPEGHTQRKLPEGIDRSNWSDDQLQPSLTSP